MSDDERRQWRELEAALAQHRRLVRLARQLESAGVYTGFRRIAVLWTAGAILGLVLVIAGAALHSTGLLVAAVATFVGTVLTVGVSLIVVQVVGIRAERER